MKKKAKRMDKYDREIERLLACGDSFAVFAINVARSWTTCGPLFARCGPPGGDFCGCLTQVRAGFAEAYSPEITKAIRADSRLPASHRGITKKSLPVFAEWQRRLDRLIGTKRA